MLSVNVAYTLCILAFAGIIIVLLVTFEYGGLPLGRKLTKIDRTANILNYTLPSILGIVIIYSIISIFYYESTTITEQTKTVTQEIEKKYDITLSKKQQENLSELIQQKNNNQDKYSTGTVTINGKTILAIWENNQIYLLEFKKGEFVEIQN